MTWIANHRRAARFKEASASTEVPAAKLDLALLVLLCLFVADRTSIADNEVAQRQFDAAESLRLDYERDAALKAISLYETARDEWRAAGRMEQAAVAAERIGLTYHRLGALDKSAASYAEGRQIAQAGNAGLQESRLLGKLGIARALLGDNVADWQEAEAFCRESIALALDNQSDTEHANGVTCLGEVEYARGRTEEALSRYEEAEDLLRQAGSMEDLAQNLLFQGYSLSDLSAFDAAGPKYEEALDIWQSAGNQHGVALALVAIARMERRQSRYLPALAKFYAANELFERMGDVINLASSYQGIAYSYMDTGRYRDAVRFWLSALELFQEAELFNYIPFVLEPLGLADLALGDYDRALGHLHRAHDMSERSGNALNQAYALRHLGFASFSLGRHDEALGYLTKLLDLDIVAQFPRLEADALSDVGQVHIAIDDAPQGMEYLERALALRRESSDRTGEARELFNLAGAYSSIDDLEPALRNLEAALNISESLRTEVVRTDLRASYIASVHEYYRLHVDLLLRKHEQTQQAGFASSAFQASERARARLLLEHLATTGIDLREGADATLVAEERALRERLNESYQRQVRMQTDGLAPDPQLSESIRDLEMKHAQIKASIDTSSPQFSALLEPRPLSMSEVQANLLDDATVLLEYALGDERSYLWVVSKTDFAVHTLPPRADIDLLARRSHALLASPSNQPGSEQDYWEAASRLSQVILPPEIEAMSGMRLLVVADGALQYIPFGALPLPPTGQDDPLPILARHEVVSLPSASSLAVLRKETADREKPPLTLAVLADPVFGDDDPRLADASRGFGGPRRAPGLDTQTEGPVDRELRPIPFDPVRGGDRYLGRLSHTALEADRITAGLPADEVLLKVGFEANRATAISPDLADYRILHFATHAMFNETEPGLSGLILSRFDSQGQPRNGFVRLNDIYELHLPAELVVLSACDTALGNEIEGEGIVGIVRGFMYAGSKRVVASLWQVPDAATARLMSHFYDAMLNRAQAPAAALRLAQLEIMNEWRWRHPYYWAAFTLQGEWRPD